MKDIHKLLHSSIMRIMIGGFLFVIIPVIALCLIYSFLSMDLLRDEYDISYANNTKLISDQFSDKLRDLEMTAAPLMVYESLIVNQDAPDLWDYNVFKNELSLDFASRFIAANVSVILPAQKRVVSTRHGVESFEKYETLWNIPELCSDQPVWALRPSLRTRGENCLSIITGYVHPAQSRPIISIEISESEVLDQLETIFGGNDKVMASFLIDVNGGVIKLDQKGILDDDILQTIIEQNQKNVVSEPFTYKDAGGLYRIVFSKSENYSCLTGIIYNEQKIIEPLTKMVPFLIAILIFALILASVYIVASYTRIYSPANALIEAMRRVAGGDLQFHASVVDDAEFGMMSKQFNSMVDQLDSLLKEKYLAQANLNKAQLKFLKSQIKPHFLYNCLFSLYNMIKGGDLDHAADMAIYLGRFYQMSSHFDDKDVTVLQEIENINLYIKIHQLRSPEKFEYSSQIDEGLETMLIPALSLQTIVENAISHAFELNDRNNIIHIKVAYNGENLELTVEDNGIGLTGEQREKILQQTDSLDLSEQTHGIQNVFMRFRLMYSQAVEFKIISKIGEGTTFIIIIPSKQKRLGAEGVSDV